jgi:hypothetical protein
VPTRRGDLERALRVRLAAHVGELRAHGFEWCERSRFGAGERRPPAQRFDHLP